jgi:hypothetical protein
MCSMEMLGWPIIVFGKGRHLQCKQLAPFTGSWLRIRCGFVDIKGDDGFLSHSMLTERMAPGMRRIPLSFSSI